MADPDLLISFLVVVRNERDYIEQCLQSMLHQTLAPTRYEILVIDGMSTDGSRELIKQMIDQHADRSVRLLDNPGRILSSGWNIGIKAARGRYVIRPDAHGEVPENFLQMSLAVIEATPGGTAGGGSGRGAWACRARRRDSRGRSAGSTCAWKTIRSRYRNSSDWYACNGPICT